MMMLVETHQPINMNINLYNKNDASINDGAIISVLPKVILLKIMQMLEFKDYARIFCVCKQWKILKEPLFKLIMMEICRVNNLKYYNYQETPKIFKDLPSDKLLKTKLILKNEYCKKLNVRIYRSNESQYFYEGKFDYFMNGKGICYYKNSSRYEGTFSYSSREGKGAYYWKNGDFYEGDWKNNKRCGVGFFRWGYGSEYYGDWNNNKREGKGRYIGKSKNVYEGEFKNNLKHGKGVYRFTNGDVYEGDFHEGKRSGKGKYTWKNGDVYNGDYFNKKRTGNGEFFFTTGDHYKGEFLDNLFHGDGVYEWSNGETYSGKFLFGSMVDDHPNKNKNGKNDNDRNEKKEDEGDNVELNKVLVVDNEGNIHNKKCLIF